MQVIAAIVANLPDPLARFFSPRFCETRGDTRLMLVYVSQLPCFDKDARPRRMPEMAFRPTAWATDYMNTRGIVQAGTSAQSRVR